MFKTIEEILSDPWNLKSDDVNTLPARREWQYKSALKFEQVVLWEEIYNQPGNISVYAAWDPYAEFYIIVYNLFSNTPSGIQQFYGIDAVKMLQEKLKTFNITLPTDRIWVAFSPI
jgi:hypothetical protein